ncbi:MAG: Na+ dependent nucleoside transporter [Saprospiraceae bacterium]|nr:Na+ dependent nucleoside transporter [Saprospiraceae bacterium]
MILDFLRAGLGLAVFLGILLLMSNDRRNINWRLVGIAFVLQFVVALLVLKLSIVRSIFDGISSFFVKILEFTNEGSAFLFKSFVTGNVESPVINFAFNVLPTIIFFSAVASMLYYFGILQFITKGIAWVMSKTMKLTGAESMAAASNIFIGQTEAPLVVKPYLEGMSKSEIAVIMVGGFAHIAGSVLASYVRILGGDDPVQQQIFATHLLTASVMSAPAAILVAKILMPETREVTVDMQKLDIPRSQAGTNVLDAIAKGSTDGLRLAVNVGVMLLVFTALVSMLNYILTNWIGGWTGLNGFVENFTDGRFKSFNLQFILGILFSPVAWLLGVPNNDIMLVGQLLGTKTAINEFVAYSEIPKVREFLSEKSILISTYALCGFANFASIGIQIGGIGALAPGQRQTLTSFGLKAMIGGTIATFITAITAGLLIG